MPEKQQIDRLVWIDIEMTGLDPFKCKIIEIAALVTDLDLNIIDDKGFRTVVGISESDAQVMDDFVRKMHTDSGLLDEALSSKITIDEAQKGILDYLMKFVEPQKSPFCGNSMVTDRMFLKVYMKELDEFLHYRNIDVSTLKQLYSAWSDKPKFEKVIDNHTAFQDIVNAINELKFYREYFIKS